MGPRQLHLEVPKGFEGPNGVGMVWVVNICYYMLLYVIIWLIMVDNNLVGGIPTPLKNMCVRQLG